jgi:hypothetical protein
MKGFTMSNVSMQVLFPFSDIEMSKSRYMLGKSSLVGVQFDDGACRGRSVVGQGGSRGR